MAKRNTRGGVINISRSEIILKTGEVIEVTLPLETVLGIIYRRIESLGLFPDSSLSLYRRGENTDTDEILTELYFPTISGEREVSVNQIEIIRKKSLTGEVEADYLNDSMMDNPSEKHMYVPDE